VNNVEAIFVSTEGEYLEAVVEASGERLHVMDECGGSSMSDGQRIEIELEAQIWDPGEWDEVFGSNPEKKKALVRLAGWRYQAVGQIVAVNPVVCDCGLIQAEGPIRTHDPSGRDARDRTARTPEPDAQTTRVARRQHGDSRSTPSSAKRCTLISPYSDSAKVTVGVAIG